MTNPTRALSLAAALLLPAWMGSVDGAVNSQMGTVTSDQPLFVTATVHCDEMIGLHRWDGNCCSLNVTAGNGCILNVMDGRCAVRGGVWTLDYNSTYDQKPCPDSEYTWQMLGMKSDPNAVAETSGGTAPRAPGWAFPVGGALALAGVLGLW